MMMPVGIAVAVTRAMIAALAGSRGRRRTLPTSS
jgi:hypothetical protein